MPSWAGRLFAITIVTEHLDVSKRFYSDVFGLAITHEDQTSVAFQLGEVIINVLAVSAAPGVIDDIAPAGAGTRSLYTIPVDDVDAVCQQLVEHGIEIISGPIDRPWGPRTACVSDPSGHLWEIAGPALGASAS